MINPNTPHQVHEEHERRIEEMARCAVEAEKRAEKAERERDALVDEYERAAQCGKQGYAHALMHMFNLVFNSRAEQQCRQKTERERDAYAAKVQRAQSLADMDRVDHPIHCMEPEKFESPGWRSQMGRDLHAALNPPGEEEPDVVVGDRGKEHHWREAAEYIDQQCLGNSSARDAAKSLRRAAPVVVNGIMVPDKTPLLEELSNIVKNEPVFPGHTISHSTANECVKRGWAQRNEEGDFILTKEGREQADRVRGSTS